MLRFGKSPFLEASTKGDKRFSPFFAYVNGRSIEHHYQASKIFSDGSCVSKWATAKEVFSFNKGKKAINTEELSLLYSKLWDQYIDEHPELQEILKTANGISDLFGDIDGCCQARELWRIKEKLLNKKINWNPITTLS